MHTRRSIIMLALVLSASAAVAAGSGTRDALGKFGTHVTERSGAASVEGVEGSLAFQVDMEAGITEYLTYISSDFRRVLRRAGIGYAGMTVVGDRILFELPNPEQSAATARLFEQSWPEVAAVHTNGSFEVFFAGSELAAIHRDILQQTLNSIRTYFSEHGIDTDSIRAEGQRCILAPPPAADILKRFKEIHHSRSTPTFRLIDTNADPNRGEIPRGFEVLDSQGETKGREPVRYVVHRRIVLRANYIVDVSATMENGRPVVIARFDVLGRRDIRERLPGTGRLLAIVLDGRVIAATRVERRLSDRVALHGDFALEQAEELAAVLRVGSYPAPVKIVDRCPE